MKTLSLKTLVLIAISMLTIASCSKKSEDAPAPPADPITGKWVGTYRATNSPLVHDFRFNVKPAGVLEILDNSDKVTGTGTWKLENSVFYATYKYKNAVNTYGLAAKYDETELVLNGSYGGDDNIADGDFTVVKQ